MGPFKQTRMKGQTSVWIYDDSLVEGTVKSVESSTGHIAILMARAGVVCLLGEVNAWKQTVNELKSRFDVRIASQSLALKVGNHGNLKCLLTPDGTLTPIISVRTMTTTQENHTVLKQYCQKYVAPSSGETVASLSIAGEWQLRRF